MKRNLKDLLFAQPKVLHFQLEDRCNMACPMCMTRSHGTSHFDRMTPEEIKNLVLAPFRFAGGRRFVLSGGEPTLSPDLNEIVEYSARIGLFVSLTTNLYRVTPEQMQKTLKTLSDRRHFIFTSYDSIYPDEIRAVRGVDAHRAVTSNLLSLLRIKKRPGIETRIGAILTLQEDNCRSIGETLEFLQNLDLDRILVSPVHLYDGIDVTNYHKAKPPCSGKMLPSMLAAVDTVFQMAKSDERIFLPYPDIQRWYRHFAGPLRQQGHCRSDRLIFVSPHGDLRGCIHSKALGNIRDTGMVDFLASEPYAEHLRLMTRCSICTEGCS